MVALCAVLAALGGNPASAEAATTIVVRNYYVLATTPSADQALVPVLRTLPATAAPASSAVRQLLAGPNSVESRADPAVVTKVPSGVLLLGLRIAGGVATVNLSSRFEAGTGRLAMELRLAQLTWTLTQFRSVTSVRLLLSGRLVTDFSAAHIQIHGPLTRDTFRDDVLPSVFVDRPAWHASLPSGSVVSGLANVFEAQFPLTLLDSSGHVLVRRTVLASCGTGCWGRFDVRITYHVGRAQRGRLRVSNVNERTGAPVEVRDYPVLLTPPTTS